MNQVAYFDSFVQINIRPPSFTLFSNTKREDVSPVSSPSRVQARIQNGTVLYGADATNEYLLYGHVKLISVDINCIGIHTVSHKRDEGGENSTRSRLCMSACLPNYIKYPLWWGPVNALTY